jgi:hypothetical protein
MPGSQSGFQKPSDKKEYHEVMKSLSKRKDMALKDIHYAAHILHPKFSAECLHRDEPIQGTKFIDKGTKILVLIVQLMIAELVEYHGKEGFFGKAFVLKSASMTDAAVGWTGVCYGSESTHVSGSILNMPPTSAATERRFSTQSIVYTTRQKKQINSRKGWQVDLGTQLTL